MSLPRAALLGCMLSLAVSLTVPAPARAEVTLLIPSRTFIDVPAEKKGTEPQAAKAPAAKEAKNTADSGKANLILSNPFCILRTIGSAGSVKYKKHFAPEELARRCLSMGAELLPSNADFCAHFSFLPRCSLWLKVWFADDELPPSGRLLIDESAPHYLTIEDAVTAGSLILDALTGAQHWNT